MRHIDDGWDLIIAHPPCTDLASSGARWFPEKRADGRMQKAVEFFLVFTQVNTRFAIENPVGIMSSIYRKPDQIIQPYYFGDPAEKRTCLWLSGIPMLQPSEIVSVPKRVKYASGRTMPKWYADAWSLPPEECARVRSRTFPGIASAMAEQWGNYLLEVL